jgi:hypothetical protein
MQLPGRDCATAVWVSFMMQPLVSCSTAVFTAECCSAAAAPAASCQACPAHASVNVITAQQLGVKLSRPWSSVQILLASVMVTVLEVAMYELFARLGAQGFGGSAGGTGGREKETCAA